MGAQHKLGRARDVAGTQPGADDAHCALFAVRELEYEAALFDIRGLKCDEGCAAERPGPVVEAGVRSRDDGLEDVVEGGRREGRERRRGYLQRNHRDHDGRGTRDARAERGYFDGGLRRRRN